MKLINIFLKGEKFFETTLMDLKKQMKINHLIYLFLLKELGNVEKQFIDSLVHIYKTIRLNTGWKLDKTFVSYNFNVVDTDQKRILESLSFFGLINSDFSLTEYGEDYLKNSIQENEPLQKVFQLFLRDSSGKIAYENTCLSASSPTTANCGLCKNISCTKKTKLFDVFSQYLRVPNHQRSFSKA